MRVVMFYHSLLSDWHHGNAHFLRGVATELATRGHDVHVFEPADSWSLQNLLRERGTRPVLEFHARYPRLRGGLYNAMRPDLDGMMDGADLVIVHEWNTPELVAAVGERRARLRNFRLLFHDTNHRAVSAREELGRYDLRHYDAVLAFGGALRDQYLQRGWAARAFTWHEAADTRVFHPVDGVQPCSDLVWIGNWGDDERSAELQEFLLTPIQRLRLRACVFGARYPVHAEEAIRRSGARYRGSLSNFDAPQVFSRHRVTVHVPRRPYVEALPGIPGIRVFEALACGIPLISAPWQDTEGLFSAGADYLLVHNGDEMVMALRAVLSDPELARAMAARGLSTILARHTCAHRVDELLAIHHRLTADASPASHRSQQSA